MRVRAITIGLDPGFPLNRELVATAGRFAARVRTACADAGVLVQTVRLATPPFPLYLGGRTETEILRFAAEIEGCCREHGIDYCSLGPLDLQHAAESRLLALVPPLIARTEAVFVSAVLGGKDAPAQAAAARAIARVIGDIARLTPMGFGNLRFAALVNCPPHIPFFPAAFHAGQPAYTVALEAADVVAAACAPGLNLAEVRASLRRELESRILPLQNLLQQLAGHEFVFRGIDLSPAPGPTPEASIAYALERLGLGRFGEPGTLTAAALVTAALKETSLYTCGYCGLMLPVLEDVGLAERNNQGLLRLSGLLAYSAVCGTGLDTIPLPGDVSEAQLLALLLDVATLGWKLGKPLSARLFPIPGKQAGEQTEFNFAYFVNTRVMAVE
ncbi:MAG TPA: DUF711 family protein [Candidatus Binatia bacterium]|nr:DUF711 family protein [Candidatus Binatia bacterium]